MPIGYRVHQDHECQEIKCNLEKIQIEHVGRECFWNMHFQTNANTSPGDGKLEEGRQIRGDGDGLTKEHTASFCFNLARGCWGGLRKHLQCPNV